MATQIVMDHTGDSRDFFDQTTASEFLTELRNIEMHREL
ncbi:hypothetical protein ABID59_007365 [Bradyrhizobium sp. S3.3.6]